MLLVRYFLFTPALAAVFVSFSQLCH